MSFGSVVCANDARALGEVHAPCKAGPAAGAQL